MFKMKSRITLPCCGWHVFIQMLTLSLLDARLNTRKILGNQTAGYYQNWRYRATSQLSMWTSHWEGQYCQPCHSLLALFVLRCFFPVCLSVCLTSYLYSDPAQQGDSGAWWWHYWTGGSNWQNSDHITVWSEGLVQIFLRLNKNCSLG